MPRPFSKIHDQWWDYTTLDPQLLSDAARLTSSDIEQLSRPGFTVHFYDNLQSLYVAEAMEYVRSWQQSTATNPTGICGPIGPIEQLPIAAQIVNDLEIDVRNGHFWAMDEWYVNGKEVDKNHPMSFRNTNMVLCFNRIDKKLRMPEKNLHFLKADNIEEYSASYDAARCLVMQGGQGEVKHWAFNDPPRRKGKYQDEPPAPEEFRKLGARVVDLHPLTLIQNARTSAGGMVHSVAEQALTVGPVETWKSDRVSIWHPGNHDNAFGLRLTALMISKKIPDSSVPMSLLADHPDVHFHYYRDGIGSCRDQMFSST